MNQNSQYIFNLLHYLIQLRDTLQYTLDKEHSADILKQRKNILVQGITPNSHLGAFLENNKEQGDKIKEKLNEFISEVYGDDSHILTVHENMVRVDHTQHIVIFDYTVGLCESIRDIIFGYINHARANNALEKNILELIILEDRFYRALSYMIILRDFQKSFVEFQKVMSESQGKATPQSNYIVQNELQKMAGMLRFIRNHNHFTDNETLDVLDHALQVIEMTEGRRDRRDNKSFKELFEELGNELNTTVAKLERQWNEVFKKNFDEFMEELKKAKQNQEA